MDKTAAQIIRETRSNMSRREFTSRHGISSTSLKQAEEGVPVGLKVASKLAKITGLSIMEFIELRRR